MSDPEYKPSYQITVPRISSRSTLEQCRLEAMVAAAKHGLRGEPEVEPYDGRPRAWGGPMRDPQGYIFRWPVEDQDSIA